MSETIEQEAWLIWSDEHCAWWRKSPEGWHGGYALSLGGAGRWTLSDAEAIVRDIGSDKKLDIIPDPYGPYAEREHRG